MLPRRRLTTALRVAMIEWLLITYYSQKYSPRAKVFFFLQYRALTIIHFLLYAEYVSTVFASSDVAKKGSNFKAGGMLISKNYLNILVLRAFKYLLQADFLISSEMKGLNL